jgi:putative DNA primase/helicase
MSSTDDLDRLEADLNADVRRDLLATSVLDVNDGEVWFTDVGNAKRLVRQHGHRLRYVGCWSHWLVWDGKRWAVDTAGSIVEAAKQITRLLHHEAMALDGEDRSRAVKWALQSENVGRIRAMVDLARSDPAVAVDPDELDTDGMLLNVHNGIIDLRTGRLSPHDPARLITKIAGVSYDPDAVAPIFAQFLERILPDPDVREFLARAAGYALTGDISEHKLFVAWGTGANGKTTLLETLNAVMGDYAGQLEADLLLARNDGHPTGIADLRGQRLVVASESDQGRRLAEGVVKRLTGGDRIKARRMHQDFFEFSPMHKLWLLTNHRPDVRGTDQGIWRRLRLLPFEVTIDEADQDKRLPVKLLDEAEGILAWAVAACLRWQADGLTEPLAVQMATAAYRAEQDVLGEFLGDCCQVAEEQTASAADLFAAYSAWCSANGEEAASQKRLGTALTERGFERVKRGANRRWHWVGLGLIVDRVNP